MALDPVKNFAKVTLSTGYAAGAVSVVLATGDGAKLPDPGVDGHFNLVWWNSKDYSDPTDDPDHEIVRVTAKSSDTLTITRAQEGTTAVAHNTNGKNYKMILAMTKKMMDDIESLVGASTVTASQVLTGTTAGSNVTLNLASLDHAFVSIVFISRNGQVLTPGDTDDGYTVSGATATVYDAASDEKFVVCYTYTS